MNILREITVDAENYKIYSKRPSWSHSQVQSGTDNKKVPTLIIFKDLDGQTYVLTHGRSTREVAYTKSGLSRLKYMLISLVYPATLQAWRTTKELRKSLPSDIGEYNLICCYGGMIKNNDPLCRMVNMTNEPCFIIDHTCMWGCHMLQLHALEEESED